MIKVSVTIENVEECQKALDGLKESRAVIVQTLRHYPVVTHWLDHRFVFESSKHLDCVIMMLEIDLERHYRLYGRLDSAPAVSA